MKLLNLIIAFILASITLPAQTYIGIDAAVNSSHWTLSLNGSHLTYSSQFGLSAGIPVEFSMSKLFDISTGVRLANKGTTTIEFTIDNIKIDPVLRVYYIEVPVLLKGKFGSEKILFNPIGGFSAGYGFSGRIDKIIQDINGNGYGHINNQAINFKEDELNRLNIQLHIGAGVTFILSTGNLLQLDIQYLHGVTNLSSSADFKNEDSFSVTARGFELSVGYLFKLGNKKST